MTFREKLEEILEAHVSEYSKPMIIDYICQLLEKELPKEKEAKITDDRSDGWLERALEGSGWNTCLKEMKEKLK